QNTTWWPEAFELLYLPAYCSFRMTDIWRSFIAQKIAWLNNWAILFHEPTVRQERNEHNLLKDFADEVPGYLNNDNIRQALDSLDLKPGTEKIADNLRSCYEKLISMSLIGPDELKLLDVWLEDIQQIRK
ncbi:MAG: STELLO glycosyltransferase family protein, partial [Planctomycetota bacterium]